MRRLSIASWGILLGLSSLIGLALMIVFSLPFDQARMAIDRLSKDGSMDSFSANVYQAARMPALGLGLACLALAALLVTKRERALSLLVAFFRWLPRFGRRMADDSRQMLAVVRAQGMSRWEMAALGGLLLLAILARVPFVMRPFYHDEAYTVAVFAISPVREFISDYHLPNNHLFHTLLVHFAYRIWGIQPWAVRLPALLAGVLAVPVIYLLGRVMYNRWVALAAGAAFATLPALVYYSVGARGYTLVILFALLGTLLGLYVRRRASLLAWIGLVLCGVLGLFTIPLYLAPFGALMAWLFLVLLVGDFGPDYNRRSLLAWLVGAGLAVALLTFLLYLPVIQRMGIEALNSVDTSHPLDWGDYMVELSARIKEHFADVTLELPPVIMWLVGIGAVLSLIFPPKPALNRARIPLMPIVIGWTVGLFILLRAPLMPRFAAFLIPFWLLWAAAGWLGLAGWLAQRLSPHQDAGRRSGQAVALLSWLVLLAALAGTSVRLATNPEARFSYKGKVEQALLFLQSQFQPMDLVVVNTPDDAIVWYYARLHRVDMNHFKRELPFMRVFVLVDSGYNQTLEKVVDRRGPETKFLELNTAREVFRSGTLRIIEITPKIDLVRKAFNLP